MKTESPPAVVEPLTVEHSARPTSPVSSHIDTSLPLAGVFAGEGEFFDAKSDFSATAASSGTSKLHIGW